MGDRVMGTIVVRRLPSSVSGSRLSSMRPINSRTRLCRRFHIIISGKRRVVQISGCLFSHLAGSSHGHVRGTTSTNFIVTGNGTIGDDCGIGPVSMVAIVVSHPHCRGRIVPRSVPLSVMCRSGCLVMIGGPTNLIIRPNRNGCRNALIGTVT